MNLSTATFRIEGGVIEIDNGKPSIRGSKGYVSTHFTPLEQALIARVAEHMARITELEKEMGLDLV